MTLLSLSSANLLDALVITLSAVGYVAIGLGVLCVLLIPVVIIKCIEGQRERKAKKSQPVCECKEELNEQPACDKNCDGCATPCEEKEEPEQESVCESCEEVNKVEQEENVQGEEQAVKEVAAADGDCDEESSEDDKITYEKSYLAKLSLTKESSKQGYSKIKNRLLSYDKVRARISWKEENFRIGKTNVAKIGVRGKTVILYLALNPSEVGEKYDVYDALEQATKVAVPCAYKLTGVRRFTYACELIDKMFEGMGVVKTSDESVDYCKNLQVTDIEQLAEIGLVKVSKSKPVDFKKYD